ncbi:MAG: EamA family transporter [Pseudomonadota bacterium]
MTQSVSLLILLGFIWGSGYTIARYAMTHGVHPLGYSFWQALGPAILLLLMTLPYWYRRRKFLLRPWRYYIVTGVLGIAIPNTNMYFCAPHLPAGIVAIMVNTVPLIIYPLALLVRQERFNYWRMIGVILGVIGIMMVVIPTADLKNNLTTHWLLITLITPLSFACCIVYINKYRPSGINDLFLSAGMLTVASLILIPLVFISGEFYPLSLPLTKVDGIVILEIVLSSIGYVLLFRLIKIAGPVFYSLANGVVCLTGLFWGRLIFSEKMNAMIIIAVIFILIAIILVTTQKQAYTNE